MGKLRIFSIILIIIGIIVALVGFMHLISIGNVSTYHQNISTNSVNQFETRTVPAAPIYMMHSTEIELLFEESGSYEVSIYYQQLDSEGNTVGGAQPTPFMEVEVSDRFSCSFDEWMTSMKNHRYYYTVEEIGDMSGTFNFTENLSFSLISPVAVGAPLALLGVVLLLISMFTGKKEKTTRKPVSYTPEPTMSFGDSFKKSKSKSRSSRSSSNRSRRTRSSRSSSKGSSKKNMVSCKFCGEFIPADSYYCPKCYGKLK